MCFSRNRKKRNLINEQCKHKKISKAKNTVVSLAFKLVTAAATDTVTLMQVAHFLFSLKKKILQ